MGVGNVAWMIPAGIELGSAGAVTITGGTIVVAPRGPSGVISSSIPAFHGPGAGNHR